MTIPGKGRLQRACLAAIKTPRTVILHRNGEDEARPVAMLQQDANLLTHRLIADVRAIVGGGPKVGERQKGVEAEPRVGLVPAPEGVMKWMDGDRLVAERLQVPGNRRDRRGDDAQVRIIHLCAKKSRR